MAAPVLSCVEFDSGTGDCVTSAWIEPATLLPPLSAEAGLEISGVLLTVCAGAWGLKALRRMIWARA